MWSDTGAPFQLIVSGPWSMQFQSVFVMILNHKQWEGQNCSDFKGPRMCKNSCFCSFSVPSAMAVAVLSLDQLSHLSVRVLCRGWCQNIFVLVTESSLYWCLVHNCQHVDILSFHNMAVKSCLIIFLMSPTWVSLSFQNYYSFLCTLIWEHHSNLFLLVCKSSYKSRDEKNLSV